MFPNEMHYFQGGGRVVWRCRVSYVTGASNLILAYSWTRPAILVAGKGRGGMFLFLLFLHYHSYSSFFPVPLFHLLYYLFYIFSPFLWETTQNDPQGLTSLNPNTIKNYFQTGHHKFMCIPNGLHRAAEKILTLNLNNFFLGT